MSKLDMVTLAKKAKRKAKAQKKVDPHQYLFVHYDRDESGGEVCEGQENDSWPSYEPSYIHQSVRRISRTADKGSEWHYDSVEVNFLPKENQEVYLVVVTYSGGSTFGSSHGHHHYEGIYETAKEAEKVAKSIRTAGYQGYTPWTGYFNALEGINVVKFTLDEYTTRSF